MCVGSHFSPARVFLPSAVRAAQIAGSVIPDAFSSRTSLNSFRFAGAITKECPALFVIWILESCALACSLQLLHDHCFFILIKSTKDLSDQNTRWIFAAEIRLAGAFSLKAITLKSTRIDSWIIKSLAS